MAVQTTQLAAILACLLGAIAVLALILFILNRRKKRNAVRGRLVPSSEV